MKFYIGETKSLEVAYSYKCLGLLHFPIALPYSTTNLMIPPYLKALVSNSTTFLPLVTT